jgi:hypothetical protein
LRCAGSRDGATMGEDSHRAWCGVFSEQCVPHHHRPALFSSLSRPSCAENLFIFDLDYFEFLSFLNHLFFLLISHSLPPFQSHAILNPSHHSKHQSPIFTLQAMPTQRVTQNSGKKSQPVTVFSQRRRERQLLTDHHAFHAPGRGEHRVVRSQIHE